MGYSYGTQQINSIKITSFWIDKTHYFNRPLGSSHSLADAQTHTYMNDSNHSSVTSAACYAIYKNRFPIQINISTKTLRSKVYISRNIYLLLLTQIVFSFWILVED